MLNKLLSFVRQYDMLQPHDRVICAVSGGADSVALLFAMYLLREKLQINLQAAHFNHRLRGAESDRDEAFVRDFCDGYGIPLHTASERILPGHKGLEAAAREARYRFFDTLDGKIATAHTADDNAETVLMRMVRGTGLKGLGAIAPVNGKIIRPMLSVTRDEVVAFLEEYHLPYVEDSTNTGDDFLRNRLRHHIMPLLKQENPRFAENTSAMALRLRMDEAALTEEVCMDSLSVQMLLALSPARRNRAICAFLEKSGVKEPEAAHIAAVEKLLHSRNPSARADLPGGVSVGRNYDTICRLTEIDPLVASTLQCPGMLELPRLRGRILCRPADAPSSQKDCFAVLPQGQLRVRTRQAGDTLRLSGGTKSLKKIFIDKKIPASLRSIVPVIADDVGVLGVWGIGPNLDRLSDGCSGVLICFQRDDPAEC